MSTPCTPLTTAVHTEFLQHSAARLLAVLGTATACIPLAEGSDSLILVGLPEQIAKLLPAAANKAAEEGGLPFAELSINQKRALSDGLSALEAMADIWAAEIRLSEMAKRIADAPAEQRPGTIAAMIEQAFIEGAYRHFLDHKLAADRASRQVANKAEVDLSSLKRFDVNYDQGGVFFSASEFGKYYKASDVESLLATPPATTGASTGWQKLNDVQWMNIVNHDRAYESYSKDDAVHEAVKHTEAKLKELNAGSVGASTVLTDERTSIDDDEFWSYVIAYAKGTGSEGKVLVEYLDRRIAREVAAQAGQRRYFDFAPSPAKESK